MTLPLSVCLCVSDEEDLLERNLRHLRAWAAEVVVAVTDNSRDRTFEIASALADRCVVHAWDGSLARARNRVLAEATRPWILVLDGDEHLCPRDVADLPLGDLAGYTVPIRNYSRNLNLFHDWRPNPGTHPEEEAFSGCPGYWSSGVLRLFRNRPDVRYEDVHSCHPSVRPVMAALGLPVGDAAVPIHHFEHRKGGEAFTGRKTAARLEAEIAHLAGHPDDARSLVNVARSLLAMGREAEAVPHLERARAVEPERYEAWILSGMVARALEDLEGAAAFLTQAAALRPGSPDALALRGIARCRQGRPEEARRDLEAALAGAPWHVMALNSLGIVWETLGRPDLAEDCYRRALLLNPHLAEARYNLGTLCEARGAWEEARAQYEAGLAEHPEDTEMRERLEGLP